MNTIKPRHDYAGQIAEIADQKLAEFVKELPKKIDATLKVALLNIFGIEEEGYGYNNKFKLNRNHADKTLLGIIERETKRHTEEVLVPMIEGIYKLISTDKTLERDIIEEARRLYRRTINDEIKKAIAARAISDARELIQSTGLEQLLDNIKQLKMGMAVRDVYNAATFDTPLGEILLEETARRMAAGEKI